MELTQQHKKEIEDFIILLGGPNSAIECILEQTGPLYSNKGLLQPQDEYVIGCLDFIASIRHINENSINRLVGPYNLFYKNGYVDADEQGVVKWNDPEYQMEWPTDKPILQKRDR